ncbi:MAG: hypothetical protein Q4P18_07075 [Methanobrevibacter sp.]|uniref:hypothetical protein n=1 Tax=Methanobrevibacter sp. TaxID=66852 RepID=UPI0026DF862E|nr:hypothetical protein [Methanobrevibacter sp.]MDO5849279.1 hypothetical protein [Methanobrevibacter sp.]
MGRIRYPKEARVSIRTTDDLKRKSQIVKGSSRYTDEDFWRIGMEKLASRMDCLEFEKGEKELEIANLKSQLYKKESELCNINNEIRVIEPRKLNDLELASLIGEVSHGYAKRVFDGYGENALEQVCSDGGKSAVLSYGRKNGFDANSFLECVVDHLRTMCHTGLSYDLEDEC